MRHRRSVLTALATSSLVLAAAAPGVATAHRTVHGVATSSASRAVPKISWGPCTDPDLKKGGAQCGMLTVPLDHAHPAAGTIKLAVARKLHTTTPYRGVMFSNPGGPGGGAQYLALQGSSFGKVGTSYDWYGMDPRGVGGSEPALTCDGKYFGPDRQPYDPTTKTILSYWLKKAAGYAKACGSSAAKKLLPHLRTTDNVADFETLRTAIGVDKVSFYGFSYGTYIAEVYATLHPDSLDRVVMDGVIDPGRVFYGSNLDQDYPFSRNTQKFFDWAAKADSTYHLGKTGKAVAAVYGKLHDQLTAHPAGGGQLGPDELDDALTFVGYSVFSWPALADALADLQGGDAKHMVRDWRLEDPIGKGADNGYAIYAATECTDAPWPTDWSRWKKDNDALDQKAHFFTWPNAWFNAPCLTWPVAGTAPVKVSGAGLKVPVLLISETLDAATPFSGALHTRTLFPTSALVAGVGGTTHAASPYAGSCVKGAVSLYLATGKLPARKSGSQADKSCDPIAPPPPMRYDDRQVARAGTPFWARSLQR